jgi:uncharacterized protein
MIIYPAQNHRVMPWANGQGTTTELLREDGPGGLRFRLSIATVTTDGPFSLFPEIDRVLTVISGAGFHLTGDGIGLHARPLRPVAFPGDVAVAASGVTAPSEDFNLMIARHLPKPMVWVTGGGTFTPQGRMFLVPLAPARIQGQALGPRDLIDITRPTSVSSDGPIIAVEIAD